MPKQIYHFRLSQLDPQAPLLGVRGNAVSGSCLHYCAPSAGGWGIVRIALLVPESVMLFIAPHGCGRHGAVASMQLGYRNRIFYLDVSEADLVLGDHINKIDGIVDYILAQLPQKPKAFLICASCIDDLLASDYRGITARLTKKHGIPFGEVHMNPITKNSSTPPPLNVQRSIYRFLWNTDRARTPDQGINLIGHFSPVDRGSELYPLLKEAGFSQIRQVAACSTFEEFMEMRNSRFNLLLKQPGRLACQDMGRSLDIPFLRSLVRYRLEGIAESYRALSQFLNYPLNWQPYYDQARQKAVAHQSRLQGLRVAVGESVNGSPFELACALAEYGAEISFIMSSAVADYEWEYVDRLRELNPDIPIYTSYHPTMSTIRQIQEQADLAIGFDASYICPEAKLMVLDSDQQHYGFKAAAALLEGIDLALAENVSAKELLYSKALVV